MRLRLKENPNVKVVFAGPVEEFLAENPDWEKVPADEGDRDRLLERLAALEHQQWAEWASTLMTTEDISEGRRERWTRLIGAHYDDLSEAEKQQDRVWAEKVLKIVEEG